MLALNKFQGSVLKAWRPQARIQVTNNGSPRSLGRWVPKCPIRGYVLTTVRARKIARDSMTFRLSFMCFIVAKGVIRRDLAQRFGARALTPQNLSDKAWLRIFAIISCPNSFG